MNAELKTIVEQVNKMFGTSYNLMSFDSITNTSLLQILGDVLVKLGVLDKINVANDMNTAIVDILDGLLTIKYSPPSDVSPINFREGIATGKRSVIYPILNWLFLNQEKVKKIKYLSTYMEKIRIPDEFKSDNDVIKLFSQYEKLIEEFWNAYSEHKKVEKQATEAMELKKDIKKMEADTAKLKDLVENQKHKVSAIPNNSSLLVLAKDYHDAITQRSNLEEQLKTQKKAIEATESEIRHLRDHLQRKRAPNPTSDNPLEVIKEEVHINKILAESKLPEELKSCKLELELYSKVVNEPEPSQADLNKLSEEIENISSEVKSLQRKMATHASEDQLAPFRNQVKIVANKKNELSNVVMNLKQQLEELDAKIVEKRNTLQSILGGPAMYGSELKKYISTVRDRCNLYKELRGQEQALRSELGVLNRTLEILKSLDPSISDALDGKPEETVEGSLELPEDETELRNKCRNLIKEINKKRAEVMTKQEQVILVKKEINAFMHEYKTLKQEFDEATGPLVKKLETTKTEIALLESSIKEQEDQYKSLQQEIEKNENILQSLSEEMLDEANGPRNKPTQMEALKAKVSEQQNVNRKLKKQLKEIEDQQEAKEGQIETLRVIQKFLKCKLEQP